MALYRRGKVWYTDLQKDGVSYRQSTGTTDRAKAERVQDERRAKLTLGYSLKTPRGLPERPVGGEKTWDDATQRWLEEKASKRDLGGDRQKIEWLKPHFGGRPLSELTLDVIEDVLRKKRSQTSASTANRTLALIRGVLRRAAGKWRWGNEVPALTREKEPPGRDRWLTPEEVARLLAELPDHQRAMVGFAFATGQRQGAIKGLKWDRVNLDKRFCWIDHATSKTGKPIPVPLNDEALAILHGCAGGHPDYVFTFKGQPITSPNSAAWKKALARAGIKDFRWHDTRHTWASHHAMNGTPIDVIKELGGWSSLQMPMRYRHYSIDALSRYSSNAVRVSGAVCGAVRGNDGNEALTRPSLQRGRQRNSAPSATFNPLVEGSNPSRPTNDLAQDAEEDSK